MLFDIKPFVEAQNQIFYDMAGLQLTNGEIEKIPDSEPMRDKLVQVDIFAREKISLGLSVSTESARSIASAIMGGSNLEEDLIDDVIREIMNMIVGSAQKASPVKFEYSLPRLVAHKTSSGISLLSRVVFQVQSHFEKDNHVGLYLMDIPDTRTLCVMFFDIRGFTGFSEKRNPEEVVDYLNVIFGELSQIINSRQGKINRFLGDGFIAIFDSPNSNDDASYNAVSAAVWIRKKILAMVDEGRIPLTKFGIGMHTGPVVAGNVGSRFQRDYTIVGDTVNLAARLEKMNKHFESSILFTEEINKAVWHIYEAEKLPRIKVRGREQPVQVYKLA